MASIPGSPRGRRPRWTRDSQPDGSGADRNTRRWAPALGASVFVLACAALLAWSCRGALSGIPLADDFAFLERIRFQRPLDFFDSMGAAYYWRPISRQLYFLLMSPLLLSQPRWAAAIH